MLKRITANEWISIARGVIKPSRLNTLMHMAVENDIAFRKLPGYELWSKIPFNDSGHERVYKIEAIAFKGELMYLQSGLSTFFRG